MSDVADEARSLCSVLLDLDGTLTDNYEGISRSIVHALARLDLPAPDDATLRACVGPPLRHSFGRLLQTDDRERSRIWSRRKRLAHASAP